MNINSCGHEKFNVYIAISVEDCKLNRADYLISSVDCMLNRAELDRAECMRPFKCPLHAFHRSSTSKALYTQLFRPARDRENKGVGIPPEPCQSMAGGMPHM